MTSVLVRGDVVLVDLNVHVGVEKAGIRPCIVVQREVLNRVLSSLLVIPLTDSSAWRDVPAQVRVPKEELGAQGKDSVCSAVDLRQIDKSRMRAGGRPLARLPSDRMNEIDHALIHALGLTFSAIKGKGREFS